jgi:hypothetical protein
MITPKKERLGLDEMRSMYFAGEEVTDEWKKALRWHLKHGDQFDAISVIGDIALCKDPVTNDLAPDVLALIHQDDYFIGQEVVSCILVFMKLPEYADFFLKLFNNDRDFEYDEHVKSSILSAFGYVLDKVQDIKLQKQIALLLYEQLNKPSYYGCASAAYSGILTAMEVPLKGRQDIGLEIDLEKDVDWGQVERFKQKYGIFQE